MTRRLISSGSKFEELARYSRAVVDGDWIFVSGTIGPDPATGVLPPEVAIQARNCFATIERALADAGSSLADVVRCRVYVTRREFVADVSAVLAEKFDRIRPANTTVVCELPPPDAKVEIEVTARRRA